MLPAVSWKRFVSGRLLPGLAFFTVLAIGFTPVHGDEPDGIRATAVPTNGSPAAAAADAAGKRPPRLRVLTYNIHHGEGMDGRLDLPRIAAVIQSASPELVALQEVDQNVARSGSVDQAAELARLTGMHFAFGKNIDLQGGAYGNAVLSKYPIEHVENHALPSLDDGEQRGVLEVHLTLPEAELPVAFLATHLDHRRDHRERIASAEQINHLMRQFENRTVLLAGDLNAQPDSQPMQELFHHWRATNLVEKKSIPVVRPTRQIDYILYRPGKRLIPVETRVLDEAVASDHRPVAASFVIRASAVPSQVPLRRIAFGSCIRQDRPVPILQTMIEADPNLLLLLGDNIYADTSDMVTMRAKYERLAAHPDFASLRAICPMLATWDDHDYGENDAGESYSPREASQQVFVDFWSDPLDAARRSRPGVYTSAMYGPPGQRVQVILLDTRYFRSPLKRGEKRTGGPYLPDTDPRKQMLGEAQWKWLKEQLELPADLRLIGSGIQCLASAAGQETWSNLPLQRQRLLEMIRETPANGVIILSGDRHWAELSLLPDVVGYPLYDITSSSLNQKHGRGTPTQNAARALPKTYHEENFGLIDVDWQMEPPTVSLKILDVEGKTQLEQTIAIEQRNPSR